MDHPRLADPQVIECLFIYCVMWSIGATLVQKPETPVRQEGGGTVPWGGIGATQHSRRNGGEKIRPGIKVSSDISLQSSEGSCVCQWSASYPLPHSLFTQSPLFLPPSPPGP